MFIVSFRHPLLWMKLNLSRSPHLFTCQKFLTLTLYWQNAVWCPALLSSQSLPLALSQSFCPITFLRFDFSAISSVILYSFMSSLMLSSHIFLGLPLLLFPCTCITTIYMSVFVCCRTMFWLEAYGEVAKIMRSDMDGANRRTLIDTEIIFPVDLSIDYHMGHRLYWSDPKKGVIESTASDGSDRVIIIKDGLCLGARNIHRCRLVL